MTSEESSIQYGYIDVGGVRTRYLVGGTGNTNVLLLHPGGLVAEVWLPLISRLTMHARIFAPDLPGHGQTRYLAKPGLSPHQTIATQVAGFADAMGLEHFCLAGSSLGAHIALLTYFDDPERVLSLALFASATSFASESQILETLERHRRAGASGPDQTTLAGASQILHAYTQGGVLENEEAILLSLSLASADSEVAASRETMFGDLSQVEAVHSSHIAERLGEISVPSALIWGQQDPVSPVALAADGASSIPGCELTVLDQCGHLPFLEHPDAVALSFVRLLET